METVQKVRSTPINDPILAEYLREGTRAFDSILGLEPQQSSGQESSQNGNNYGDPDASRRRRMPLPPPPPVTDDEYEDDEDEDPLPAKPRSVSGQFLGGSDHHHHHEQQRSSDGMFLTPQPQRSKVFLAIKNPHYSPPRNSLGGNINSSSQHSTASTSPTTLYLDSMSKKVAGDRWIQDESLRPLRSLSDHYPATTTAIASSSRPKISTTVGALDAQLAALDHGSDICVVIT
jgi:hypothetical protein